PWLNRVLERRPRALLKAVDGVSFTIAKGETLGLVGECGSSKSTVARLIVGLYRPTRGEVRYAGRRIDANAADPAARRNMQMIFQDPYASLNPRWRVADIVAEPLRAGRGTERGPVHADAARSGAGSRQDRQAADGGRRRSSESTRTSSRLHVSPALSARRRALPARVAFAEARAARAAWRRRSCLPCGGGRASPGGG